MKPIRFWCLQNSYDAGAAVFDNECETSGGKQFMARYRTMAEAERITAHLNRTRAKRVWVPAQKEDWDFLAQCADKNKAVAE